MERNRLVSEVQDLKWYQASQNFNTKRYNETIFSKKRNSNIKFYICLTQYKCECNIQKLSGI